MEIGSEFDLSNIFLDKQQPKAFCSNAAYFATGRAAIYAAIEDIKTQKRIKKAYLPDYCCFSMVEPFIKNGIEVIYYEVVFSNGGIEYKIDFNENFDIFFAMSYFGFEESNQDQIVLKLKQKGVTVIEDITHRLLSNRRSNADYFVASIRKWVGVFSGGMLVKANGTVHNGKVPISKEFLQLKESAMSKKLQYLNSQDKSNDKKAEFLDEFSRADTILCTDWQDRAIDEKSLNLINHIDKTAIANRRRENAKIIYTAKCKNLRFMFNLKDADVPLFVPVIFNSQDARDAMRKRLCDADVYCPIHWPNETNSTNLIYTKVLSIVIDQRYNKNDMQRIVNILENFA